MRMFKAGAAALAMSLAVSVQAEAQLVDASTSSIMGSYWSGSPLCTVWAAAYTECPGSFSGNNTGAGNGPNPGEARVLDFISSPGPDGAGWLTDAYAADGVGSFSGELTAGTLNFNDTYFDFVLALKAANGFSLYYFETDGVSSIDFSTIGTAQNGGGNAQALSHWNLYASSVSVPEPGMMLLLSTGFLGLAAIRRRREDVA